MWDDSCPFLLGPMPLTLDLAMKPVDSPDLTAEQQAELTTFVRDSNKYNNILALGAVGIENAKPQRGYDHIVGNHCLRMSGRSYHFIPKSNSASGVQYFLHSGRQEEMAKHGEERQVDVVKLKGLYDELLHGNKLCKLYSLIGATADRELQGRPRGNEIDDAIYVKSTLIPILNLVTQQFDVSSITMDRRTGNHYMQVKCKQTRDWRSIDSLNVLFEPIGYPLLFPNGEDGWDSKNRVGDKTEGYFKMGFSNYLASRMLMPEKYLNYEACNMPDPVQQEEDPFYGKHGRWLVYRPRWSRLFLSDESFR